MLHRAVGAVLCELGHAVAQALCSAVCVEQITVAWLEYTWPDRATARRTQHAAYSLSFVSVTQLQASALAEQVQAYVRATATGEPLMQPAARSDS